MRMNNKGVSLVEMIIVVAIISALSGLMSIGLSSVVSKPAEECAEKIVSTLKNARITTMGKRTCEIYLKQASSGAIVQLAENIDSTTPPATSKYVKIGEKNITVTLHLTKITSSSVDTMDLDLSSCSSVKIEYRRETGGFKPAVIVQGSNTYTDYYITGITVHKGTTTKEITLARLTGKISID